MNNYYYKYEIKSKGIELVKSHYNDFSVRKKNSKIDAEIYFSPTSNLFEFYDHKNNETVDLKKVTAADIFKNYFKQVLGTEEIPLILFNRHFVLNCTKKSLEDLYLVVHTEWCRDDIHTAASLLAKANLIFGIQDNALEYKKSDALTVNYAALSTTIHNTDDCELQKELKEVAVAYMLFKEKHPEIENNFGIAKHPLVRKALNALHWGSVVTGLDYKKVAEIYLDEKFEIENLPFNNNCYRITNKKLKEEIKIISDNINSLRNPTEIITDEEYHNNTRDFNLNKWIAEIFCYGTTGCDFSPMDRAESDCIDALNILSILNKLTVSRHCKKPTMRKIVQNPEGAIDEYNTSSFIPNLLIKCIGLLDKNIEERKNISQQIKKNDYNYPEFMYEHKKIFALENMMGKDKINEIIY